MWEEVWEQYSQSPRPTLLLQRAETKPEPTSSALNGRPPDERISPLALSFFLCLVDKSAWKDELDSLEQSSPLPGSKSSHTGIPICGSWIYPHTYIYKQQINFSLFRLWKLIIFVYGTVSADLRRRNLGFRCRAWGSLLCRANPLSRGGGACVVGGAIGGKVVGPERKSRIV